eukprot:396219_1
MVSVGLVIFLYIFSDVAFWSIDLANNLRFYQCGCFKDINKTISIPVTDKYKYSRRWFWNWFYVLCVGFYLCVFKWIGNSKLFGQLEYCGMENALVSFMSSLTFFSFQIINDIEGILFWILEEKLGIKMYWNCREYVKNKDSLDKTISDAPNEYEIWASQMPYYPLHDQ